jgi:hypothetical protein
MVVEAKKSSITMESTATLIPVGNVKAIAMMIALALEA